MSWDIAKGAASFIFAFLWPPPLTAPPEEVQRYRWRVTVYILSLGFGLATAVVAALGGMAWLGFPGFALANESQATRAQVSRIEARMIRDDILEIRREQCKAINARDVSLKESTLRRLEEAQIDFAVVTGKEYKLPDCDEL